jgi:hypothetical protein
MTPRQITTLYIFCVTLLGSCDSSTNKKEPTYTPTDTSTSFKIDNYWLTPKKTFDFNSLGKLSGDTLHLVTCSEFVYFPFGKLTDESSLKTSMLKNFTITNFKRDTFTNTNMSPPFFQWSESVDLQLGDNKLNLFLDNDPEASTHGYIRGGHIADGNVKFLDNIKIGISAEDFYKIFFDYFPTELYKKYKVVELESCVSDVTHSYTFDKGQLSSVKFN